MVWASSACRSRAVTGTPSTSATVGLDVGCVIARPPGPRPAPGRPRARRSSRPAPAPGRRRPTRWWGSRPRRPRAGAGRSRAAATARDRVGDGSQSGTRRCLVRCGQGAGGVPVFSCIGDRPPIDVLAAGGARALAVDATALTEADDDAIGRWVEGGGWLLLGLVPPAAADPPASPATLAEPARARWRRLGFDPRQLADVAVATPTTGLAGVSPAQARVAMTAAREVGRVLAEAPEGGR